MDRDKLHREVLRTFDNACVGRSAQYSGRAGFVPLADVYFVEESRELVVRFELPGLARQDIQLEVEPRKVVVHGRRTFLGGDRRVYQQVEMDYGDFERQIRLAVDVDVDAAQATYDAGVLEVRLPLLAHDPRKQRIEIRIGGES
ncbi:MAG: Hsp20/alpha crystallin family protein [Thermoleophilia bacterium]